MHIFFSNKNAAKCASNLDDFRVPEQITNTSSILSTAVWLNRSTAKLPVIKLSELYKLYLPHNADQACVRWGRETRDNYFWLVNYLIELRYQAHSRYLKLDFDKIRQEIEVYRNYIDYIPEGKLTIPPNTCYDRFRGINYSYMEDVYLANIVFLTELWKSDKIKPKWSNS